MINIKTQKGIILNYMQKHSKKRVTVSDFQWWFLKPFVWYKANTRIWELCKKWLLKKDWVKEWRKIFLKKSKPQTCYLITEYGLNYKLK